MPNRDEARNILILTDYTQSFKEMIDPVQLQALFQQEGMTTEVATYEEIDPRVHTIRDTWVVYTSSQLPVYKRYIEDLLYVLMAKNTLVPRYEMFKCHNDKVFQERFKGQLGISSLPAYCFATQAEFMAAQPTLKYPLVYKGASGWAGGNVRLVHSAEEVLGLNRVDANQLFREKFLLQAFVPHLSEDWRVAAMAGRFFVLNRKVRPNDFRASGEGKKSFIDPPRRLLDFAQKVYQAMDVPCLTMDLGYGEDGCSLFEFQGVHFGQGAVTRAPHYFEKRQESWSKVPGRYFVTKEYARSVLSYIRGLSSQK
jgi:glutathione synthase/RimK-type ligase-like ATP-grasp enzyme